MNNAAGIAPRLERVTGLSVERFVSDYVEKNRPVVITGAMKDWKALDTWAPETLAHRFGKELVQVYGDLFQLAAIMSLSQYFDRYFGKSNSVTSAPYVRWYCHLVDDERVPWADEVFAEFHDDWSRPAFFPSNSFALPYCGPSNTIDPSKDWFPARGLFISARGARTRLHVDPWCSDALLCQIYGQKDFLMYAPSQAPYLTNGTKTIDIAAPDPQLFPTFGSATPAARDSLKPGEIAFVPAGWFHHFDSVTDSISLTWNFVHYSRMRQFFSYLSRGPAGTELKQLSYAYSRGTAP